MKLLILVACYLALASWTEADSKIYHDRDATQRRERKQEKSVEQSSERKLPWDGWDFDSLFSSNSGEDDSADGEETMFSKVWVNVFSSSNNNEQGEQQVTGNRATGGEMDFMSQLAALMTPWWRGPNICTREEQSVEGASAEVSEGQGESTGAQEGGQTEEQEIEPFAGGESDAGQAGSMAGMVSGLTTSCQDHGSVYKCTMRLTKGGKTMVKSLIYECCHGFEREQGKKGCTKEVELQTLKETIESLNATKFLEAVDENGLSDTLFGDAQNRTIFVPSNEALTNVVDTEEVNFVVLQDENKDQLVKDILKGHALDGWQLSHDWEDEKTLPTLNEDSSIRVNYYNYPKRFMTVNCVPISRTNLRSTNGVVHQVDRVIMPAQQSLWELISQDAKFSKFAELIGDDLQERLMSAEEHLTVLAFTNDAFERLPEETREAITNKETCFGDLAKEHVLPHTICSGAIFEHAAAKNLAGNYINASRKSNDDMGETIKFEGATVTLADKIAKNGVMHVLDQVILLEYMLDPVTVLKRRGFAEYAEQFEKQGIQVDQYPEVTIFVPQTLAEESVMPEPAAEVEESGGENDEQENGPENEEENEEPRSPAALTKNQLENHVILSKVEITQPKDNAARSETPVTTQSGQELQLSVETVPNPLAIFHPGIALLNAHIGCSRVVKANVKTCTGMVHIVDKPIATPDRSLMQVMESKDKLSEFAEMVKQSGVEESITDDGKFTILAPTNEALNSVFNDEQKQRLMGDREDLANFVKRHIIKDSSLCEYQLAQRQSGGLFSGPRKFETMSDEYLIGQRTLIGRVLIGGAPVSEADVAATNGMLHIMARPIVKRRVNNFLDLFRNLGRRSGRNQDNDGGFVIDFDEIFDG